ncbi:MAG TPA: DUF4229 domain-containing protein [Micromonosporaceae bacterium]|jgi:hypothetical protein
MNPIVKYTLARIALFVVCLAVVYPIPIDPLLRLLIALVLSAGVSLVVLRRWRDDVAVRVSTTTARRQQEKERLRAALAGEDEPPTDRPSQRDEGPRELS